MTNRGRSLQNTLRRVGLRAGQPKKTGERRLRRRAQEVLGVGPLPRRRANVVLGLAPQALGTEDEPHRRRREAPEGRRRALGVGSERLEAGHGRREASGQPPGAEGLRRGLDDGRREREDRRLELGESVMKAVDAPLELAYQRLAVEQKKVDSARRPRRVGGGALDQGDGAGLGQDSVPGRAGRRAKAWSATLFDIR